MKKMYQKSLQMIKELSKILTEKEWNKYAVKKMCIKYGKNSKLITKMLENALELGYNKEEFKTLLKDFYEKR